MTREEMAALLASGKQIQYNPLADGEIWIDIPWQQFIRNVGMFISPYRIKPEPKLVPFTFEDDLVGKTIVNKNTGNKFLITAEIKGLNSFNRDGIIVNGASEVIDFDMLLNTYTFLDGSPCGKVINE